MSAARLIDGMMRTLRGRNILVNLFEMWVGLAGIVSGVAFFYSPASIDDSAVSRTIGQVPSEIWVVGYMLAGLGIWWGLMRPSPRWEIAALQLLGSATAMEGIAIAAVFGLRGVATASTLLALTVASWLRALIVMTAASRAAQAYGDGHARRDG